MQGYAKDHYIDAACAGEMGNAVFIPAALTPLRITAMGRGHRQTMPNDSNGFQTGTARGAKMVQGFKTGDWVRLVQPSGKYQGTYIGRLLGIRARGVFDIMTPKGRISASYRHFTLLQRGDGYAYAF